MQKCKIKTIPDLNGGQVNNERKHRKYEMTNDLLSTNYGLLFLIIDVGCQQFAQGLYEAIGGNKHHWFVD